MVALAWLILMAALAMLAVYFGLGILKFTLKVSLAVLAGALVWMFLSWVEASSTGHPNITRWAFGYGLSSSHPELSITKVVGGAIVVISLLAALFGKD